MNINEYNLEAYKFIRIEIDKRIEYHYKMSMWKIVLGGAIIAFLIEKGQSIAVSPFFISAVFLMLMDVLILENLSYIRSAGKYVKENIENTDMNVIKWETSFAQFNDKWRCWSSTAYIFGIWIVAPLLVVSGLISGFDPNNKVHIVILIVSFYLIAYTLFLIYQTFNQPVQDFCTKSPSPILHNKDSQ